MIILLLKIKLADRGVFYIDKDGEEGIEVGIVIMKNKSLIMVMLTTMLMVIIMLMMTSATMAAIILST